MENNIRMVERSTLKEAAVALIESAKALENKNPVDAAFVAGYIARYVESAERDKPRSA